MLQISNQSAVSKQLGPPILPLGLGPTSSIPNLHSSDRPFAKAKAEAVAVTARSNRDADVTHCASYRIIYNKLEKYLRKFLERFRWQLGWYR